MPRPKAAHAQPPAAKAPPALAAGQERRWLTARPQESRDEALVRARATMPWGADAIARVRSMNTAAILKAIGAGG